MEFEICLNKKKVIHDKLNLWLDTCVKIVYIYTQEKPCFIHFQILAQFLDFFIVFLSILSNVESKVIHFSWDLVLLLGKSFVLFVKFYLNSFKQIPDGG